MTVVRRRFVDRSAPKPFGGSVFVASGRERADGSEYYRITYTNPSGAVWQSQRLATREHADIASLILSEYLGAVVR
jgi:hypothetical protein